LNRLELSELSQNNFEARPQGIRFRLKHFLFIPCLEHPVPLLQQALVSIFQR
jgi:hypothetical protein